MKSSDNFIHHIRSGVIAGLIMFLITTFFILFLSVIPMDSLWIYALSMLVFCLLPFLLAVPGVLGVSLYNRSGVIASPKEGAQIGAMSSVFFVISSLGFGILSDTLLYDPNNLIRGAAFGMGLAGAGAATLLSTLGGMVWASNSKNSSMQNGIIDPVAANQIVTIAPSNKSPIVAGLLSLFLFGGVGQIYLGQWKKGLALIFASFFFGPLYFLIIPIGASDGYGTAQKLKNGNSVGEWEFTITWKIFGWAVIATIIVFVVFALLFSFGYLLVAYAQGTLRMSL